MHKRQRRNGAALALLGAGTAFGALLSTGCGSSSSDATARISSVNLSTNAGTAGVLVNSAANGGDLTFGASSAYSYIGQGLSTFGYSTSAILPTVGILPPSTTLQLNNNAFYTSYLIGRPDVPTLSDPRFLQTVVAGNKGAAANYTGNVTYSDPPSGQANIRILNGAPDAGFSGKTSGAVDVLVNNQPAFTNVAYPTLPKPVASATAAPATTPVTTYQAFPAGTLSVQVNVAGTGTALVPSTNVSVSAGKAYTIVVTEPTAPSAAAGAPTPTTSPIYGLYTSSDQQ